METNLLGKPRLHWFLGHVDKPEYAGSFYQIIVPQGKVCIDNLRYVDLRQKKKDKRQKTDTQNIK
jgi:hypothetical protein